MGECGHIAEGSRTHRDAHSRDLCIRERVWRLVENSFPAQLTVRQLQPGEGLVPARVREQVSAGMGK